MSEPVRIGNTTLHNGDMTFVLAGMPENSIDSCVTDPPYHLASIVKRFGGKNAAEAKSNGSGVYKRSSAGFMGKSWDGGDIAFRPETWSEVYRVLKPGAYLIAFSATRTYHRMVCAIEDAGFQIHPQLAWIFGSGFPKATRIKAEGYEGQRYGAQSLKPSMEPICMAQKPFSEKTGTANILKWGTGAVNVDACRVDAGERRLIEPDRGRATGNSFSGGLDGSLHGSIQNGMTNEGRWPPNVLHDGSEEVLAEFARYGETKSGSLKEGQRTAGGSSVYGDFGEREEPLFVGDSGSPSRFYPSLGPDHQDYAPFMYEPKAGPADRLGFKHPTIKPVKLISWLCRLVTPPGGTVLDPFAGTFTTGQAALAEGLLPIGIEQDEDSFGCCKKRIEHVMGADTPLFSEPDENDVEEVQGAFAL